MTTARVAYIHKNEHLDTFMSPLTAYPELEKLSQSTFDYFIKGKEGVVKPEPGTGNREPGTSS
jgi:hypothetical protein